jgi:hypothetical protein
MRPFDDLQVPAVGSSQTRFSGEVIDAEYIQETVIKEPDQHIKVPAASSVRAE